MLEKHTTRIDKWLWAVRVFKTRSLASEACAGGKIKIDGTVVKASRNIVQNDVIQVRKGVVKYLYKIRTIAEKRMGAKLVQNYLEDITPKEELVKLKSSQKQPIHAREKGQGRPTKNASVTTAAKIIIIARSVTKVSCGSCSGLTFSIKVDTFSLKED